MSKFAMLLISPCELTELEQRLSRETGFEIESHLEFLGRCQDCQSKEGENAQEDS